MLLPSRDLLQLLLIQHFHAATVEAHPALLREIFQQAADHLAGGAHIAGHLVMGHADIAAAGLGQLVGEEDGKARSALINRICCIVHMVSEKRSAVIW